MGQFDRDKTLQQLDGRDWGEPNWHSHLVTECHRLRRVAPCDFTVEDLRVTIGQNIGLEHLMPLALERLHADPFAEGAYYPCDLLVSVLGGETHFWRRHPEWREQIVAIAQRAIALFPTVPDLACEMVTRAVTTAYEQFQRNTTPAA